MNERMVEARPTRRSFGAWVRDAFSLEADREPLTPDEITFLDRMAGFIIRKNLTVPAIMMLESLRPLNYLGSQAMAFFEPMVHMVYPGHSYREFRQILEKRSSVEIFLQRIERKEAERLEGGQKTVHGTTCAPDGNEVDRLEQKAVEDLEEKPPKAAQGEESKDDHENR